MLLGPLTPCPPRQREQRGDPQQLLRDGVSPGHGDTQRPLPQHGERDRRLCPPSCPHGPPCVHPSCPRRCCIPPVLTPRVPAVPEADQALGPPRRRVGDGREVHHPLRVAVQRWWQRAGLPGEGKATGRSPSAGPRRGAGQVPRSRGTRAGGGPRGACGRAGDAPVVPHSPSGLRPPGRRCRCPSW